MSGNWQEAVSKSDHWWPPIGSRVRYPSSRGGELTGTIIGDYRATSHRVAIWRDGENTRSVVFRNRSVVERIDGDS
jgi:hypothetical protein